MAIAESIEANSSDYELSNRIATFLLSRNVPGADTVKIEVRRGVATLNGELASGRDRALCVSCVKRVAGVRHVIDRLQVPEGSSGVSTTAGLCPSA